MRIEKHIGNLIKLLKDIRREPSPAVIGFAYSTALTHIFHIVFYDELDPGRAIKHQDFRSEEKSNKLKSLIKDFKEKDKLFSLWKELENKRNELCYGYPSQDDIGEYISKFFKIKEILENLSQIKFDVDYLEKLLKEKEGEKNE